MTTNSQTTAQHGQDVAGRCDLDRWRTRHELRRSNAAVPHRNRKRYNRKQKHKHHDSGD